LGKEDSIVYQKAFDFAVRIVRFYQFLCNEKEYVLSKQVLRSGTAIGANIREALHGQSRKDFIAKMYIALKESGETEYWIDLLLAAEIVKQDEIDELMKANRELIKLLNSIIMTSKQNPE
jgi:four helix bundle protein